jgi:hypothetical protein
MPRRTFLVIRSRSPLVVARPAGRLFRLFVAGGPTRVLLAPYFYGLLILCLRLASRQRLRDARFPEVKAS